MVKGKFKCRNCNEGRLETEVIRDLFTANMSNDEVQEDLLAERKTPEQALDYAIRREKSSENQLAIRKQGSQISTQVSNMKTEPVGFVQKRGNNNNRYSSRVGRGRYPQQQQRGNFERQQTDQKTKCFKCGNQNCKNVRPGTKSVISVTNVDTRHDYANHLTSTQFTTYKQKNHFRRTRM